MSFLNFENKLFLITGVANKKSVAYFSAKTIIENGGNCVFTVQSEEHQAKLKKLFPDSKSYIVDVTKEEQIKELAINLKNDEVKLDGMLHSIAFANLANPRPFHETSWEDFAQATQISSFSLVQLSNELAALFEHEASVVTISISDTKATSYGYMGPIKSMLETTCSYLAKSFSEFSQVRFNSVCSGPLKTSASAGIPGYIDNYIFAEKLTMRKQALKTQEVANTVAFLLSNASSGINATGVLVDCGMKSNHFDQEVVSGK
ncbi:oxidoreductase, short chain dehydrogenase/reductase family protein [Halobacteriovorax sp. BALOs_7]|uniref:enoyl-ACP reductase FabI n=1 Tax=Halobacteriovorax sp. BALOs_7 TaxID=2109558 RepID=UPI000EA33BCD|nr:SDR family oxidoreductase [Halobacteriovorax sp. BALOs_7]AYF44359.1 oxidoreductase, short chain dehydrogenase/reductase family protein [Halobacteriovorax sp. BALOs_7]